MSSSSAFNTLQALRQSLRSVVATGPSSGVRLASSSRTFASSSAYRVQPTSPSSQLEQQPQPASQPVESDAAGLESLHAGFDAQQPDSFELENEVIAVPTKPTIVHVKLSHLSPETKKSSSPLYVPLSSHVFDTPPRRDVMHSAVVYYLDAQRSGTASTKTRSDVRGSTKKLRPQKGSGNARLGTMSNPMLRGGAVAHGPRPRDHSTKLPRRVRELALRSALSLRWREGDLHVVPSLDWIPPPSSTGPLARLLGSKQWNNALFLTAPRNPQPSMRSLLQESKPSAADPVYTEEQRQEHLKAVRNFGIASGNLPQVELIELDQLTEEHRESAKTPEARKQTGELHAYEVLKRRKLILDLGAVEWLEEKLGGAIFHEQAGLDVLAEEEEQAEAARLVEQEQQRVAEENKVEAESEQGTKEGEQQEVKTDAAEQPKA